MFWVLQLSLCVSVCAIILFIFTALLVSSLLYLSSHVSVYTSVLVTGAGELQQRENCFAVGSQDHG